MKITITEGQNFLTVDLYLYQQHRRDALLVTMALNTKLNLQVKKKIYILISFWVKLQQMSQIA